MKQAIKDNKKIILISISIIAESEKRYNHMFENDRYPKTTQGRASQGRASLDEGMLDCPDAS